MVFVGNLLLFPAVKQWYVVTDVQDNILRFFAIDHVLVSFATTATTGMIFSLQFTKNRLVAGLCQDPLGGLSASPDTLAAKTGGLLLRGGEGREGKGIWRCKQCLRR